MYQPLDWRFYPAIEDKGWDKNKKIMANMDNTMKSCKYVCAKQLLKPMQTLFTCLKVKLVEAHLKVQSCKLYNNKHMIASTQISSTENFAFIAVFTLLSRKVLFINRKENRNC